MLKVIVIQRLLPKVELGVSVPAKLEAVTTTSSEVRSLMGNMSGFSRLTPFSVTTTTMNVVLCVMTMGRLTRVSVILDGES